MKISHGQLEACRANPVGWLSGGGGRGAFGYASAVKLAIFAFHKSGDASAAKEQLDGYLNKNFSNEGRKAWARQLLEDYLAWCGTDNHLVADTKPRLTLDIGSGVSMTGELSRVEVSPATGLYRAVLLLTEIPSNWTSELRWPLIQRAIAAKYSRDVSDVSVGVQSLDGAGLDVRRFDAARINKSLSEAQALASTLHQLTLLQAV